mgnify:CR=1 FL=1
MCFGFGAGLGMRAVLWRAAIDLVLLPFNAIGIIRFSPLTHAIEGRLQLVFERHGLTYRGFPYLADVKKLRAVIEADEASQRDARA